MVTEMFPVPPTGTLEETETTENSASGEAALAPAPLRAAPLDAPVDALLDARAGALLRARAPAVPADAALDDAALDDAPADGAPADGVVPDGAAPLDAFGAVPFGAVSPDALDAPADVAVPRCVAADAPDALLRVTLLAAPGVPPVVATGDSVAGDVSSVDVGVGDGCVVPSSPSACSLVVSVSVAVGDSAAVVSVVVEDSSEDEVCSLDDISVPFADPSSVLVAWSAEVDDTDSTVVELFAVRFEASAVPESSAMNPATLPWITSRPTNKTAGTERFIGDRSKRRIHASQPLFLPICLSL
jgi:hypothetical protein